MMCMGNMQHGLQLHVSLSEGACSAQSTDGDAVEQLSINLNI